MNKLELAEGLKEAIENNNIQSWINEYFERNKYEICFEGCRWLVSQGEYAVMLNGDDDEHPSLLVQNGRCENIHWLPIEKDRSNLEKAFNEALNIVKEMSEHE